VHVFFCNFILFAKILCRQKIRVFQFVLSVSSNQCVCEWLTVPQEPRVVQLVSHPFLGQVVLQAGPSQFGLNLKAHKGVSSLSLPNCIGLFDTMISKSSFESFFRDLSDLNTF